MGTSDRRDKLVLAPDLPLAEALASAMRQILQHAIAAVAGAARQPGRAVHDWRKSLRRARSLLRLVRRRLDARSYAAIADALREAQRAASPLRDADAMRPLLRQLRGEPGLPPAERRSLSFVAGKLLRRLRQGHDARHHAGDAARVLADQVAAVEAARERFERMLTVQFSWSDLEDGFRASHARARRALRRLGKEVSDQPFHDLRKSVKTLHYQAELLASTGNARADRLRGKLGELAEAQGRVTDLMVLRAKIEDLSDGPALADHQARVEAMLARLIRNRRRPTMRQARKLLDRSPRALARRLLPDQSMHSKRAK